MNGRGSPCLLAVGVPLVMAACSGRTRVNLAGGGSDAVGSTGGAPGATGAEPTGGVSGAAPATAGAAAMASAGAGSSGEFAGAGGELNVSGSSGVETGGTTPLPPGPGPCDVYRDAGQPCVAAYSTVRRLSSTYTGPLYQVRSGSSEQNTG